MWFVCECGGIISNAGCPSPSGASLVRDQDIDGFLDTAAKEIMGFFQAVQAGRRSKWRGELVTYADDEIPDADIVNLILLQHYLRSCLTTFECKECGRL